MVNAIESAFVPLLVKNNADGSDAELLKRFKEPAWNYQVVRFLDAGGADIIPRKDRVWTTPALAARMVDAKAAALTAIASAIAFRTELFPTPFSPSIMIHGSFRPSAVVVDATPHAAIATEKPPEDRTSEAKRSAAGPPPRPAP